MTRLLGRFKLSIWIIALIGAFATGVIGYYAERMSEWIEQNATYPVTVQAWVLIVAFLIIIGLTGALLLYYREGHQQANRINKLDDSLLKFLVPLFSIDTQEKLDIAIKQRFLEELLRKVNELFVAVYQAAVMRPDPKDPSRLCIWGSAGLPYENVRDTWFDIGEKTIQEKRGCAADTYLDGKIRIVRLEKNAVADNPCYKSLSKYTRHQYSSFAVVPLINSEKKCIGVLCLNSRNRLEFGSESSEKDQELLLTLAQRIAIVIEVYEIYRAILSQQKVIRGGIT
jgi:GAF domain-containing protein